MAPPSGVLSDALHDAIGGRDVVGGVFTTFQFDPAFFERHILPILFEECAAENEVVLRCQLEEALKRCGDLAVYYDRQGLIAGGTAYADVRRIAVSRTTGYFHPKVTLLLLRGRGSNAPSRAGALLVAVASANLTESGWWKNVECAHLEVYEAGDKCSMRGELLALVRALREEDRSGMPPAALEAVHRFVRDELEEPAYRSSGGRHHPRFYVGQSTVPEFLREALPADLGSYNLEIVSPYFDNTDSASTVQALVDQIGPKATRIYLPRAEDGTALCSAGYFAAVAEITDVSWASLPSQLRRAKDGDATKRERFVHAKVYRLWSRTEGREFIFAGSVNLTQAGHSKGRAGNLEAAVLVESQVDGRLDFWLEDGAKAPTRFSGSDGELEETEAKPPPLSLRFDWGTGQAEYFLESVPAGDLRAMLLARGGVTFARIESPACGVWTSLAAPDAAELKRQLKSGALLQAAFDGEPFAYILVREEGMALKPGEAVKLSPEDILAYWSKLSPEQREAFLAARAPRSSSEGEGVPAEKAPAPESSFFDSFAGIFHAFHRLEASLHEAFEQGREKEVLYRLFGGAHDSLRTLLTRLTEDELGGNLLTRYVQLLSAQQLLSQLRRGRLEFYREHREHFRDVEALCSRVTQVRERLAASEPSVDERFLQWFENQFMREAALPEVA